jgi:hypothetical protein
MAVPTSADILRLRGMVNEPTAVIYSDTTLMAFITPYNYGDEILPLWDLHRAASDVWEEKAAKNAHLYQFSADGGSYSRHQIYQQFMGLAHWHRARRKIANFFAEVASE